MKRNLKIEIVSGSGELAVCGSIWAIGYGLNHSFGLAVAGFFTLAMALSTFSDKKAKEEKKDEYIKDSK